MAKESARIAEATVRYFTKYWQDGASDDDAVRATAEAYWRHVHSLGLPASVMMLADLNPHDAYVLHVEHQPEHGRLALRLRCGDLQIGYFDADITFEGVEMSSKAEEVLRESRRPADVELLYDEVDRAADCFEYRLSFSHGSELCMRFRDVRVRRRNVECRDAL